MPEIDATPEQIATVKAILRRHVPDREVWAFGSRARWTAKEYSDLDLAILGDEPLPEKVHADLVQTFDDSDLPWKVDVVEWAQITPSFRAAVSQNPAVIQGGLKTSEISLVPGWKPVILYEIADYINGRPTKPSEVQNHGIPVIKIAELNGGISASTDRVPAERVLDKHWVKEGDLLFAWSGSVGIHIYRGPTAALNQHIFKVIARDGVDQRFLYYLLDSQLSTFSQYVENKKTTMGHVTVRDLKHTYVQIPPLEEQRAIAHILGTLDDKIELNRRMSETLEATARALFKSWFVDFDPVRAKAEGRDPGLPQPLADLFPDSFEDSELGEIPRGWRLSRLGDELETLLGGTPSRGEASYWGGDIPWINSGKANEFRVVEPSEFITRAGLDSSATKLLPARSTVVAITGATLGQVSITEIATCANQSIVGVLGSASLPSEFIYFWVKENIDRLIASQTGGAQQHINKNNVNELPTICPGESVINAYLRTARATFDRIKEICFESRTLGALRDTLLPKLISGELRVDNTEQIVARADA